MKRIPILSLIIRTFALLVVLACFGTFPHLSKADEFKGEYYEPLWPGGNVAFEKIVSTTAARALLTGASEVIPLPDPTVEPWKSTIVEGDMAWGANASGDEKFWYYAKLVDSVTRWTKMFAEDTPIVEPLSSITEWKTGNHSARSVTLATPAFAGSLEITCITDPPIANTFEWIKDIHYTENIVAGKIISITPAHKLFLRTRYRIRYVPND